MPTGTNTMRDRLVDALLRREPGADEILLDHMREHGEPIPVLHYHGRCKSMSEIERANHGIGHHFFEPDTMRFFNSRNEDNKACRWGLFVQSDQLEDSRGNRHPRVFKICQALVSGQVQGVRGGGANDSLNQGDCRHMLGVLRNQLARIRADWLRACLLALHSEVAEIGHFDNTVFVNVRDERGEERLAEFTISRMTKADGSSLDGAIRYRGVVIAHMEG